MSTPTRPDQLLFRLRPTDSEAGVSRNTLSRLATTLGIKETQVLHYAVRQLARDVGIPNASIASLARNSRKQERSTARPSN